LREVPQLLPHAEEGLGLGSKRSELSREFAVNPPGGLNPGGEP
jgi:hypothetical protein